MGTDKAFLEVHGRRLIDTALGAIAGASQRLVVGGDELRLREVTSSVGAQHLPDRWPGKGPLGALATALAQAQHPVTAILPCDLPGISPEDVAALVNAVVEAKKGRNPAAAIFVDERRHYLPMAVQTEAAALAGRLFIAGKRAVASLLDELAVVEVAASPTAVADVDGPEDL